MQNTIKRDKSNLHENSNIRLNNRDMLDIQLNKDRNSKKNIQLDRIDIERDEFMRNSNSDQNNDSTSPYNFNDSNNSNNFNENFANFNDDMIRGMPMRGNVQMKDDLYKNNNNNNDDSFLKGNHIPNLAEVNYFDPSSRDNFSGLADINQNTQLTSQLKNKSICVEGINILGCFTFNNLCKLLQTPFIINNFGLYNAFVPIYIASKGNTEIELKNYFLYPRKDIIQDGILELIQTLNKSNIKIDSCILLNNNLDINSDYCASITNITKVRTFNPSNTLNESETINRIINNTLQTNMKKTLTSDSLKNTIINLINYSYINPSWHHPFNKSLQGGFLYRNENMIKQEFMECNNDFFGYFQDQNNEIIELKCEGVNLVMGIMLSKNNIILDEKQLSFYTKNIKPVKFSSVIIPKFKIQTKLRYNSFLQQTNLRTVFMDLNVPEMINESCNSKLTDVIQNIEINIENSNNYKQSISDKYENNKKFIANRSFMFYFRIPELNLIPLIGYY
jgi:hypothetical protein